MCVGLAVMAVAAATAHGQEAQPSEGGKEVASFKTHWDIYCVALSSTFAAIAKLRLSILGLA